MTDVYTLGEPVGVVSSGRVRHESEARLDVCGPEFTLAIALARLGHRCAYLGKVAGDELGARALTVLRGEGVDVEDVRVTEGARTGLLLRESRVGREPAVTHYRTGSAGALLAPGNVPIDRIAAARMLHVTGLTAALSRDAQDAVRAAVSAARTAEVPISFSVEYVPELWPSVREAEEVLSELACQAHLLFLRQDELDLVKSALTPEREVVVDRGAKGASVRADRMRYDVQGWQVPVVDTAGAGEAFAAGYISAALDGLTPQERLHRGALLSAAAVSGVSDWQGLPTRAEL
ncbi:2-dehydro-3-deoxygluconate kinase [[Actinomadura] parvosata subsp. kistnae]|uniref:2-keto-3-deoxygluconate kinase n=1 Tax=[Actinomadura] parvosata subsp. kistnae TaxID=1909395 RepID=A0A1V0A808_9ACTN|nr:sugar kinase [Nonomuraea sp. ATCC 55076]AQZ66309.1 2-keto-3-deoxygluconate kinase [Nonomuraea sp. ATCC 55076]SPL95676.1 2-dehydro-3-deoxygluconate kinase [Actinomadura parvosata subsp. kistnae]